MTPVPATPVYVTDAAATDAAATHGAGSDARADARVQAALISLAPQIEGVLTLLGPGEHAWGLPANARDVLLGLAAEHLRAALSDASDEAPGRAPAQVQRLCAEVCLALSATVCGVPLVTWHTAPARWPLLRDRVLVSAHPWGASEWHLLIPVFAQRPEAWGTELRAALVEDQRNQTAAVARLLELAPRAVRLVVLGLLGLAP